MSDAPYIPFYTSDFLAGTSGMTASAKGVYITLLCLMYEAEGPLTQKWDTLARRCGCTLPAFRRAISDLQDDGKIEETEAGLWSQKCEKHITQRRERSSSAKAAAKKRWEKTEQKQGQGDASASSPQCQPEPEPEPIKRDTNVSPKKGMRLPVNWALSKELGDWALNEGLSSQQIRQEADKFKDYWIGVSGVKGVKRDWPATWRNWIRNSKSYQPKGKSNGKSSDTSGNGNQFDAARERALRLASVQTTPGASGDGAGSGFGESGPLRLGVN